MTGCLPRAEVSCAARSPWHS